MAERPMLLDVTRVRRVVAFVFARRSLRTYLRLTVGAATVIGVLLLAVTLWISRRAPTPVGNPDPGHRLLNAIRPVVSVVPSGATITFQSFAEPRWDSCDGIRSSCGWDPATVDIEFIPHGLSDAVVFTHIETALGSQGWIYDETSPSDGVWYWNRQIAGQHSWIQLISGDGDSDPNWALQANAPPATHPIKGC